MASPDRQPLVSGPYRAYTRALEKVCKAVARQVKDKPLDKFTRMPPVPTVHDSLFLRPTLEVLYGTGVGGRRYFCDVVFAFVDSAARTAAQAVRTVEQRATVVADTEVFLFVHWYKIAPPPVGPGGVRGVHDPLAHPFQLAYLGDEYAILSSKRDSLKLVRVVKTVPQLGSLFPLVPAALPTVNVVLPPAEGRAKGVIARCIRRFALMAFEFFYVG